MEKSFCFDKACFLVSKGCTIYLDVCEKHVTETFSLKISSQQYKGRKRGKKWVLQNGEKIISITDEIKNRCDFYLKEN